jgi:probable phosphoglycerate mutase
VIDFSDLVRARLMLFNDTSHYSAMPSRAEHRLSKWF